MDHRDGAEAGEARFAAYVERLASVLGHADRAAPLKAYCTGLILPGERKSIEPIAARVEPGRVQAAHQSLHHFVAKADWSDEADFWSQSEAGFPPQAQKGRSSRHLAFPRATVPGALPLRPERHVETSIMTLRIHLAHALARRLPRCPCCFQNFMTQ